MSWGNKIAIAYSLFVVLMITLVSMCIKQKDIFLVSDDYYKQEIEFQDRIDKNNNLNSMSSPINIVVASGNVSIDFPDDFSNSKGTVTFYRPSNANYDRNYPLQLDSKGIQNFETKDLSKGLWLIKIDFELANKLYYKEEKIKI